MKNFKLLAIVAIAAMCVVAACGKKAQDSVVQQPEKAVYQPVHQAVTIDLKSADTYTYVNAAKNVSAQGVQVSYGELYSPIVIKYMYANGDTYTYTIQNFGLWNNEAGKLRVVADKENTVWLQGQTREGKFHEFIFYGNPKFNGKKITPNSYRGAIKYR